MEPVLHELSQQYSGVVEFKDIDVTEDQDTATQYGVQATPTFVILDAEGQEADRIVGAVPKEELVVAIEKATK